VVTTDEEFRDVRERRIVNRVRRAGCRKDGDLAEQLALALGDEAAHVLVGERLAQVRHLGFERGRGPAGRRERRVVLDPLDDAHGQPLGVGVGCAAEADRVVMRHVDDVFSQIRRRTRVASVRPMSRTRRLLRPTDDKCTRQGATT
jgi:hypothetical protein